MNGIQTPELDESGHVSDSRSYYCPECGARYETPGVCTGVSAEGGHAEAKVEKVKPSSSSSEDGGERSKKSSKRKGASGQKKTAASSKSR